MIKLLSVNMVQIIPHKTKGQNKQATQFTIQFADKQSAHFPTPKVNLAKVNEFPADLHCLN